MYHESQYDSTDATPRQRSRHTSSERRGPSPLRLYNASSTPPATLLKRPRRPPAEQVRHLRHAVQLLKRSHRQHEIHLRLAEEIQHHLLACKLPCLPSVRFLAAYRPLDHLTGDFYHAFRLDQDHVGFVLGDVVGHGAAAAYLSFYAMQALRTKRIDHEGYELISPGEVLSALNRTMMAAEFPNLPFLTAVYGVLDSRDLTWRFASGGHPGPLLLRPGAQPQVLSGQGPLIGVFEGSFEERSVALREGDRIVLYSDGVLTARWYGEGVGVEGLANTLNASRGTVRTEADLEEVIQSADFEDRLADDVTLLVAEIGPADGLEKADARLQSPAS